MLSHHHGRGKYAGDSLKTEPLVGNKKHSLLDWCKMTVTFAVTFVYEFFNFSPSSFLILIFVSGVAAVIKESTAFGISLGCILRGVIALSIISQGILKTSGKASSQEEISVGLTVYTTINTVFDYFIYSFVISNAGLIEGFIIMTILSFVLDLSLIHIYDKTKKDWLGVEEIKQLRGYKGDDLIGRFMALIMKNGNYAIMIILTLKSNPFITTIYMREEANGHVGLSIRDWKIFLFSLIVGNIVWSIAVFTGWKIFELIFRI